MGSKSSSSDLKKTVIEPSVSARKTDKINLQFSDNLNGVCVHRLLLGRVRTS